MAGNNKKRQRRERDEAECFDDPLELKLYSDPWTIKKKLEQSDVNGLSRLILPGNQVENHVLPFLTPEQRDEVLRSDRGPLVVAVKDLKDMKCHSLTLKRLRSSKSYKLGRKWTKELVKDKGLRKDDVIGMFWDTYSTCFCFSLIHTFQLPPPPPPPHPYLCQFARQHLRLAQPMPPNMDH